MWECCHRVSWTIVQLVISNYIYFFSVQASSGGEIIFSQGRNSTELYAEPLPYIASNWSFSSTESESYPMLYGRVTQEPIILERVREMITDQNPELGSFHPSLAVVFTWHNNVSVEVGPTVRQR